MIGRLSKSPNIDWLRANQVVPSTAPRPVIVFLFLDVYLKLSCILLTAVAP